MRGIFQLNSCHQPLKLTISTNSYHKSIRFKPRYLSTISHQPITTQLTPEFKLIHLLKDIKASINSTQKGNENQDEKKIINSLNSSIQDLKEYQETRVTRLGVYGDRISGRDQLINCLLCDPLNENYHQTTDQLLNSRSLDQSGLIRIRYGSIAKWNEDKTILEIPNQWLKETNLEIIEDESLETLEENDVHLLMIDSIRKEIQPQMFYKLSHFNTFLIGINQIEYEKPTERISLTLPQSLIPLTYPKTFEINTYQTLNSFKTFKSDTEDFDPSGFYKLREEINSISLNPHQKFQTSISIGRLSLSNLSQLILKSSESLIELESLITSYEDKIKTIKSELNQTVLKVDSILVGINENQIKELFNTKLQWWKVLIFSIDVGEVIRNFNHKEDLRLKLLLSYQSGQLSIYSKTLKTLTEALLQTHTPLIPSTTKHDLLIASNRSHHHLQHHLQTLYDHSTDPNLERFINLIKQEYTSIYLKYSTISMGFSTILGFSWWGNWIAMESFVSFLIGFLGLSWVRVEGVWKKRVLRKGLRDWKRAKEIVLVGLQEKEKDLIENEVFKVNENVIDKFKEGLEIYLHHNRVLKSDLKEFIQRLNQLENEFQNQKITK